MEDRSGARQGSCRLGHAADGSIVRTVCIITTAANALMAPVHDRMPVIVGAADWQGWLVERRGSRTGEDDEGLIAPLSSMSEASL